MLLSTILMYLTLAVCGLGLGAMVFKYDLHRSEPWWLLLITTILGAGFMEAAGYSQVAIVRFLSGPEGDTFPSNTVFALLAGSSEELSKFLVVCIIALAGRRYFDEPVDGLIYGSFAGLGAALAESVATLGFGQQSPFLPAQEPIRLAGHLIMGGVGGFGLGLIINRPRAAIFAIPGCLLLAALLHTLWDILAFKSVDEFAITHQVRPILTFLPILLMIGGMILFRWLISIGAAMTHAHLNPPPAISS